MKIVNVVAIATLNHPLYLPLIHSHLHGSSFPKNTHWLRDEGLGDADEIVSPEYLATEAIEELEATVEDLNTIVEMLGNGYEWRD